jgi:hypothetical protein
VERESVRSVGGFQRNIRDADERRLQAVALLPQVVGGHADLDDVVRGGEGLELSVCNGHADR